MNLDLSTDFNQRYTQVINNLRRKQYKRFDATEEEEKEQELRKTYQLHVERCINDQKRKGVKKIQVDRKKVNSHLYNFKQKADSSIAIKKEFLQL